MNNNVISNIKQKKIDNKNYYQTDSFHTEWANIKNKVKTSAIIEDSSCIDSLLEVHRDQIFFIPNYQYSLIYDNMVIQKIYSDEIIYIVHTLQTYKNYLTK